MRVITDSVPSMHTVALGIWAAVGTRHEDLLHNGAAHMVEHMLFKGTKTRNAQQIVELIENVGGHMNAYTSREITSYHVHLTANHTARALDVLADMYQNSMLPEEEIERERQVILQEIGMCHDTPDDLIFDNYYETAYAGQAMGAPILGTADIISGMESGALQAHIERYYNPARTVISAAGAVEHDALVEQVGALFTHLPENNDITQDDAEYKPAEHRLHKDLEQAHFILGFEAVPRRDAHYYAAQALSTILGGGMSSRLFQEVREKRGLVYAIFSFLSGYTDTGQFGIYAGTGPDKLAEIVPVVCEEILKATDSITENEIERAKQQLKSSMLMARESMMTRADQQAKSVIIQGEKLDVEQRIAQIDALTKESVENVARIIFAKPPALAALGPIDQLAPYDKIAARLAV